MIGSFQGPAPGSTDTHPHPPPTHTRALAHTYVPRRGHAYTHMHMYNINLNDYELETREELAAQMNDCRRAIETIYGKLNELNHQDHILFSKEKQVAALEKEKHAYEIEELKLSMVLELIDTTGRGY